VKVSIIIPVLNEDLVLEKNLKSLSAFSGQTEVIVVDGGSSDNTIEIARKYARVLSGPKGRAVQMNTGARAATGKVLIFLHADTLLPDGAIEAVTAAVAVPGVIGGRFKVRLDHPGWRYRMVGASINLRDRLMRGFTGDQAIFINSSAFRTLGGYKEIQLMEDLDLGRRMSKLGKVVRLRECVTTSARRWQRNGVLRTIFLMWTIKVMYALRYPPELLDRMYGDTR
jgi:rSAM/selenodomain-associated transferase 2